MIVCVVLVACWAGAGRAGAARLTSSHPCPTAAHCPTISTALFSPHQFRRIINNNNIQSNSSVVGSGSERSWLRVLRVRRGRGRARDRGRGRGRSL